MTNSISDGRVLANVLSVVPPDLSCKNVLLVALTSYPGFVYPSSTAL